MYSPLAARIAVFWQRTDRVLLMFEDAHRLRNPLRKLCNDAQGVVRASVIGDKDLPVLVGCEATLSSAWPIYRSALNAGMMTLMSFSIIVMAAPTEN